jgi:DNA-binding response OmpR family regulator
MHGTPRLNVLIVEDDDALRRTLADQLTLGEEFAPVEAPTAEQAFRAVETSEIAIALLDIGLPDMDGRDAVAALRQRGLCAPLIMITASDAEADVVHCLDAGAADYVRKPFRFPVLLARMRAHLRQHAHNETAVLSLGPYRFRLDRKVMTDTRSGARIGLTDKEARLLRRLVLARGEAVDSSNLLQDVWGYRVDLATHTLQTHIYRLRQKLERNPSRPRLILSEGPGYRVGMDHAA